MQRFWVYILASKRNGTLYIGVTRDLVRRIYHHRIDRNASFTCRYKVNRLVWYEEQSSAVAAFQRETSLKRWPRRWKLELIEGFNPTWEDLYRTLHD